jgi:hypothetical protein
VFTWMWFSVSDAAASSNTGQKIGSILIFCAVSDAAVASDTENHGLCKLTFNLIPVRNKYLGRYILQNACNGPWSDWLKFVQSFENDSVAKFRDCVSCGILPTYICTYIRSVPQFLRAQIEACLFELN